MNLAMLSTLVAIVERGTFAGAAQQVGCTPSAVSLQARQLEAWFGQPLFDRSARSVRPTPFALHAAAVIRDIACRLQDLRAHPSLTVSGRVRVGAIASVQTDALPQALRLLRDRYPALEVTVALDDSDALRTALKANRIDAAVVVRPPDGGSARLAWQDLARQPYVMLVPPGAQGSSPQDLLQRFELIRYDIALSGGRVAARYIKRRFPHARWAMEVRSIDAIVAMVSAGLGVAIVPQPRKALLDAHKVREVALGGSAPVRRIALVRRRSDIEHRNIDAVFDALQTAYAMPRDSR